MNSLTVSVIGPYRSGKSTLVNKLQQRKGAEEDVSFFFFKYGGKNVTLIDTPGDMDNPPTLASVLTISDAIIFCVSPENGVNLQVGEQIIMASSIGIKQGLICITKSGHIHRCRHRETGKAVVCNNKRNFDGKLRDNGC